VQRGLPPVLELEPEQPEQLEEPEAWMGEQLELLLLAQGETVGQQEMVVLAQGLEQEQEQHKQLVEHSPPQHQGQMH